MLMILHSIVMIPLTLHPCGEAGTVHETDAQGLGDLRREKYCMQVVQGRRRCCWRCSESVLYH